jgi:hypothetical protein
MVASNVWAGTTRLLNRPDLGVSVIAFEGPITQGDLQRIKDLVPEATRANPENQIFLSLASSGGLVSEGLAIGRYVREAGIGTILLPDVTCASACTFAFWGGFDKKAQRIRRIVMPGARLGVHQIYLAEPPAGGGLVHPNVALEEAQRRVVSLMEYLDEMEVSSTVQRKTFGTASKEIYYLTEAEVAGNKVLQMEPSDAGWGLRQVSLDPIQLPSSVRHPATTVASPPKPPLLSPEQPSRPTDREARAQAAAMFDRGMQYYEGKGVQRDYAQALDWWRKSVDLGDPPSMTMLGILYFEGKGLRRDYVQARRWLEKAADLGQADAMGLLGRIYYSGLGVDRNYTEAQRWTQRAADYGITVAMRNMCVYHYEGKIGPPNYAEARGWCLMAASRGDAVAMVGLGGLYESGKGVPQSYTEARRWYEKSAALGQPEGMVGLGGLHYIGRGGTQNYTEAARLFKKAADLGNPVAIRNLGIMYAEGKGVPQSYTEARRLIEKAAAKGDAVAKRSLAALSGRAQQFLNSY